MEDGLPTKLATIHINSLLDLYSPDARTRQQALDLWKEVREQDKAAKAQGNSKGFWRPYSDQVAPHFPKFLRLEATASRIIAHQLVIMPGLLQTPDYRRAIIRMYEPQLSPVDIERRIELTAHRQARLDESDFHLEVLLSEAVLRHCPAHPATMAAQLRWVAEAGERANLSVRVIPFSVGPHPGLAMLTFTLLRFPAGASGMTLPPVVYVEEAIGSVFHEHADVVDQYRQAIEGMRVVALTEEGTRDFVFQIAKEYTV
ncbi:DUF5753 domain-containing protein [Nocardia inohanensis]|uniref:DUF5753 domain-containing protein n=1 Tax=Nocardia inohanensis TaxID=209246 RepID=UPI0012FB4B84|nr:DUF5753 domain-containing protein [Nocardia inohanensis]